MNKEIVLSPLPHTWFIDIDGTIFKHNGYLTDGFDTLLPGVREFFDSIPKEDYIVLVTSRLEKYREITVNFLKKYNLRFNNILFEYPMGERIVVNDNKPSGLKMSMSYNLERNEGLQSLVVKVDKDL